MSNTEQAEQIFQSAREMMDSIRAVNGESYARTVEMTLNILKLRMLLHSTLNMAREMIGDEKLETAWDACNRIFAHVIALDAKNAGIMDEDPSELIDWAQKLLKIEERGAEKLLGDDE
jgi:hypothetical protein